MFLDSEIAALSNKAKEIVGKAQASEQEQSWLSKDRDTSSKMAPEKVDRPVEGGSTVVDGSGREGYKVEDITAFDPSECGLNMRKWKTEREEKTNKK